MLLDGCDGGERTGSAANLIVAEKAEEQFEHTLMHATISELKEMLKHEEGPGQDVHYNGVSLWINLAKDGDGGDAIARTDSELSEQQRESLSEESYKTVTSYPMLRPIYWCTVANSSSIRIVVFNN